MGRTPCTEPQYSYTSTPPVGRTACKEPQYSYNSTPPMGRTACTEPQYSYTPTPPMGRTACTEPQCLYKGALYLYIYSHTWYEVHLFCWFPLRNFITLSLYFFNFYSGGCFRFSKKTVIFSQILFYVLIFVVLIFFCWRGGGGGQEMKS
jgi:hypothetical protein